MTQKKRASKSEVRKVADLVQEAIDDGADTAEEIHKTIANLPLDVLDRLDVLHDTVKDVRKLQDESIGAIYGAIHKVNHEVTRLAAELLEGAPRKRARARKATTTKRKAATA